MPGSAVLTSSTESARSMVVRRYVVGAGIDVPRVVILGIVLEELKLVAACARASVSYFDFLSNRLLMHPDCLSMLRRRMPFSRVIALPLSLAATSFSAGCFPPFAATEPHHLVSEGGHFKDVKLHIGDACLVIGFRLRQSARPSHWRRPWLPAHAPLLHRSAPSRAGYRPLPESRTRLC